MSWVQGAVYEQSLKKQQNPENTRKLREEKILSLFRIYCQIDQEIRSATSSSVAYFHTAFKDLECVVEF